MELVKIKHKETGAIKEVKKSLAGDYLGTNEWESVKVNEKKTPILNRVEKEEK